MALIAVSCSKETVIKANLNWEDVDYFELNDGWKASIYLGAVNFVDAEDYDLEPIETRGIGITDGYVIFNVSVSSYENFTVVVFNDTNGDGSYDSDEPASVDFDTVEAGVDFTFDLTVNY